MKRSDVDISSVFYVIMIITGLVVITGGMMHARAILIPLMMASFIAIVSNGPISWFMEKGCPQWLALFLVLALFCCAVLLSLLVVGTSVKDFLHNIPEYENKLHQQMEQLYAFLGSKGIHFKGKGMAKVLFNPASAMKYTGELLNDFGSLLANSFVILLIVVFMLSEARDFPAKLKSIFGENDTKIIQLQKFNASIKQYMYILTLISLCTGVLVTLSLLVIGVDYPIMWGMLAFAFNFIPNIGSIIAAVPPVLLAMVQLGPGSGLVVAACYLGINMVMGNVIQPRFMGKGLGLSTLVVFLSVLFWGWVLGPVGMLLSVVLTMIFKIMLDSNEDTQWLGLFLGPNLQEEQNKGN
jgi:AI-2 transport protein TqsA